MFSTLIPCARRGTTSFRGTHKTSQRKRPVRLNVESLEDRLVPSGSPFVYSVLDNRAASPDHTPKTAQSVQLLPMMTSEVLANVGANGTHDVYKVQLQQGEILAVNTTVDLPDGTPVPAKVSLLNASSRLVAGMGPGKLSVAATDPGFAYRVVRSGTYFVAIDVAPGESASYELDLRPIGINASMQDPTWLQKTGGEMDVWLAGNTLEVSGPAGHGFGIAGNWKQTVTHSGALASSTYVATGMVTIKTAGGGVNVGLPSGTALTITTQPGMWGAYFGAVDSLTGAGSFSLSTLAKACGSNSQLGLGLTASLPQQNWGIDLGSSLGDSGLPLNPAVPYLHFLSSNDASASFGAFKAQLDSTGQGFNVVADPADPFLYVGIKGVPYISNFGIGWSTHGLIPFAPEAGAVPDNYHGALAGNFYHVGEVDLTDADIPIIIDGDWTVNFDPNHTGKTFGGASITASQILDALGSPTQPSAALQKQINTVFKNISFEHNGTLNLGYSEDGVGSIQVPVIQDVDVFDGPGQTLYMHGNTVNPFQGTPLADFIKGDVSVDGTFNRNSGQVDVKVGGDFDLFGQETKGTVEITNQGINVDGFIHALGTDVEMKGTIQANGDASLKGQASVDLLVGSAQGTFDLENHAGQTTLSVAAQLSALGTSMAFSGQLQANGDYTLTASVASNFFLTGGTATAALSDLGGVRTFAIAAQLNTLGTTVSLSGNVASTGDYTLTGSAYTNFYVGAAVASFQLSHSHLSGTSLTAAADASVLGQTVHFSGNINPDGTYAIAGRISSNFFLASGTADFTFSNNTLSIHGRLQTMGVTVDVYGNANAQGDFDLYGNTSANFFIAGGQANFHLAHNHVSGTSLSVAADVSVLGQTTHFSGTINADGTYSITGSVSSNFFLANGTANFTFSNNTLSIHGRLQTLGVTVDVYGNANAQGDFDLYGNTSANFFIGGAQAYFHLAHNHLSGTSLSAAADVSVLGQTVHFSGNINANGSYSITGSIASNFFLASGTASFTFSNNTLSIHGRLQTMGVTVDVYGNANAQGDYDLYGNASANFYIAGGQANFHLAHNHLSGTSLSVDGYFNALNASVHVAGQIQSSGDFSISGQASANFYIAQGNARFTFASQGGATSLTVDGWINALGAQVEMSGVVGSNGTFNIVGYTSSNFFLANGWAVITLANNGSGTTCNVDGHLNVLGGNLEFQGQVAANGDFSFAQSSSFSIPGLGGVSESFTLSSSSGNVSLSCSLNATAQLGPLQGILQVGLNITADANGHATYSGSGSAVIQAWLFGWHTVGGAGIGVANNTLDVFVNVAGVTATFAFGLPA
jgi:hypothetical protein